MLLSLGALGVILEALAAGNVRPARFRGVTAVGNDPSYSAAGSNPDKWRQGMARPAAPRVRILGGSGREMSRPAVPVAQNLLSVAVVGLTCVLKLRSHTLPS